MLSKACQRMGFGRRHFSIVNELKGEINAWVDSATPQFKSLKSQGDKVIGEVTVGMAMGGMRGIPGMLTETSYLDAHAGIEYRGHDLNACNEKLPKYPGSDIGLPEGAFWLLLTGNIPSQDQVTALTAELHSRSELPAYVTSLIDSLPKDMHAMTQLSIGILALQKESQFHQIYSSGKWDKLTLWEYALEDSVTLMAMISPLAARIFRNVYFNGEHVAKDTNLDWAANYGQMLGVSKDPDFLEMTRLYLMLHADHEGGNVSAHATHVVGSALSDPFLSYSAGVNGLAGPLHGLANQECLRWLRNTKKELGAGDPTVEQVTEFAKATLASGRVVPGFGHGVLRVTDPRYTIQHAFAAKKFPNDELFKLANVCYQAIPPVLEATGKVKNPWPNVDALSGTCMQYYGLTQEDYYTVVFAVSRSIGCLAQLTLSRRMGLPIERVKSVDMNWLEKKIAGK